MNNSELIGNEIYSKPKTTVRNVVEDILAALAIVAAVSFILWLASITG